MKSEILTMLGRDFDSKFFSRMFHLGLAALFGLFVGATAFLVEDKAFHLGLWRFLISPGSVVLSVLDPFGSGLNTAIAINTFFYGTLIYSASLGLLRIWSRIEKQ